MWSSPPLGPEGGFNSTTKHARRDHSSVLWQACLTWNCHWAFQIAGSLLSPIQCQALPPPESIFSQEQMGNSKRRKVSQEIRHGAGPAMEFLILLLGWFVAKREKCSIELITLGSDPAGWCAPPSKAAQILPPLKDCIWVKALKSYQSLQNKLSGYRKRKFLFSYLSQVYSLHRQLPTYTAKAHINHHFRQEIVIIPSMLSFLSAHPHVLHSSVWCWPGSLQTVSQVFLLTNSQLGSAMEELGGGGQLLIALFQKHQIPPILQNSGYQSHNIPILGPLSGQSARYITSLESEPCSTPFPLIA